MVSPRMFRRAEATLRRRGMVESGQGGLNMRRRRRRRRKGAEEEEERSILKKKNKRRKENLLKLLPLFGSH